MNTGGANLLLLMYPDSKGRFRHIDLLVIFLKELTKACLPIPSEDPQLMA